MDSDETASESIVTRGLNDAQRDATLRPRYSITRVVAGPGAGKTRVLTCRIAHLLLDDAHLDDADGGGGEGRHRVDDEGGRAREGILAVTFTKKAAMEMERRLTDLISEATELDGQSSNPLAKKETPGISMGGELEEGEYAQYGDADPYDTGGGNSRPGEALQRLLRRTTVGTFHSVCSKVLRGFGKDLGDLPSVRSRSRVAENVAGATVSQEGVITTALDSAAADRVPVPTLDGSFNILDQSDQLRLLKEVLQERGIVLKGAASSGGRNADIRPITVLNAISLLNTRDAVAMTGGSTGGSNGEEEEVSRKMSRKVREIAEEIRGPFQRAKYSQNSVDFDDLILLTRELLLHHPSAREALHRRWRHILVDEFQDTSKVQLDLVRLLTTNSLFAVGDGDQSIYSWRGACPESMGDLEGAFQGRRHGWEGLLRDEQWNDHGGDLAGYLGGIGVAGGSGDSEFLEVASVYLMENYRSTTNIVKAAQRVISTSEKGNSENPASAQDGIRRDMKPMRGAGPSPRVLACRDAQAEAGFVVKTVLSMVDAGDLSPSSTVAVIYRTNAQSRLLEEACVERNLRYVVRGGAGTFYRRAEIQDCLSFLKIMYNPRDRSAWARAVKAPSRGIGAASLAEFFGYCDAVAARHAGTGGGGSAPTPMDVLLSLAADDGNIGTLVPPQDVLSTRSINRLVPFASSLHSLRRKAERQPVAEFLLSVIEDLGLRGHLDALSKSKDEYEDRLGNVMELVRAAERYAEDGPCIPPSSAAEDDELSMDTPLANFLDDVALIADLAPDDDTSADEGGGRIVANLMTIHSSKGMEFDAVFLVGNEDGTLPTQKSIAEGEGSVELSEERRLCYVAMTRAKTHLVLTWRREVSYFAGASLRTRDAVRSRFLDVLVSKGKARPSEGSAKKPSGFAGNNNAPPRKGSFKSGRSLASMTKRELHSEANKYLASSGSKMQGDRQTSRKKSIAKRDVHSQAGRHLGPGRKSWDDWEPTSRKKPIKVPEDKRAEITNYVEGINRRQAMPPSRTHNQQIGGERTQAVPSPRPRIDLNSSRPSTSSKTENRTQMGSSPRTATKKRSIETRPNPMARRSLSTETNANGPSLRGEPPPPMDSTIFFPVGSSVRHRLHGRGIVQAPPNADEKFAERMLVRVRFAEEGLEWDLPMDGLAHTYE